MSMILAGKPRNSKQPKGMCALKISPHSFIAVTLEFKVKPISKDFNFSALQMVGRILFSFVDFQKK